LLGRLFALILLLPAPLLAATGRQVFVIPPGQEGWLDRVLPPGPELPGWTLEGAAVASDTVTSTYRDPQGRRIQVRLMHPTQAPADAPRTRQFALVAGPDAAPLRAALLARMRAQEDHFIWQDQAHTAPVALAESATPGFGPAAADLRAADEAAGSRQPAAVAKHLRTLAARQEALPPADRAWVATALAVRAKSQALPEAAAWLHAARGQVAAAAVGVGRTVLEARLAQVAGDAGGLALALAALHQQQGDPAVCGGLVQIAEDKALPGPGGQEVGHALNFLQSQGKAAPACLELPVAAARLARQAGLDAQVQPWLDAVLARQPSPRVGLAGRLVVDVAQLHSAAGRSAQAVALLKTLVWTPPIDTGLLNDVARIHIDAQDPSALAWHQQRADAAPDDAVSAFLAGAILHHRDAWQASQAYLARSARVMAREVRQHLYTGMNHLHLGQQREAEAAIAYAFSISDRDPDVYYCRAQVHIGGGRGQEAAADLQHYLAMTQGSKETYAPKQAKVVRQIEDLQACRGARTLRDCLTTQASLRQAAAAAPWLAGGVALVGGAAWWWRRRKR